MTTTVTAQMTHGSTIAAEKCFIVRCGCSHQNTVQRRSDLYGRWDHWACFSGDNLADETLSYATNEPAFRLFCGAVIFARNFTAITTRNRHRWEFGQSPRNEDAFSKPLGQSNRSLTVVCCSGYVVVLGFPRLFCAVHFVVYGQSTNGCQRAGAIGRGNGSCPHKRLQSSRSVDD